MSDNELIAEFMGLRCETEIVPFNQYRIVVDGRDYWVPEFNLPYKTMWSALMPVVEKIETIKVISPTEGNEGTTYNFQIHKTICKIWEPFENHNPLISTASSKKIEAVYKAVIEFVKWYNQNTVSLADSQM